jgi:hypothetical protein
MAYYKNKAFLELLHHLSGPNRYALAQTNCRSTVGRLCTYPRAGSNPFLLSLRIIRFATLLLAYLLDSLVRVSVWIRFLKNILFPSFWRGRENTKKTVSKR